MAAGIDNGRVQLLTRIGLDWTKAKKGNSRHAGGKVAMPVLQFWLPTAV
jgi:hypothetical protein